MVGERYSIKYSNGGDMTTPIKHKPPGLGEFEAGDKISFEHGGTNATSLLEAQDNLGISSKTDQVDFDALQTVVSALETEVDDKADAAAVNQALSLKADLVDGLIPAAQLPSFVDDVLNGTFVDTVTFNDESNNPYTPESGKIYVDTTTNKTYRWSGSIYVETGGGGVALGETSSTAYRGDRGKEAYDHSLSQGNPHNTTTSEITEGTNKWFTEPRVRATVLSGLVTTDDSNVTSSDSVEVAIGKLEAKTKGFNWVEISTVGSINSSYIAYTSANFPSDTCKVEVARKDGMLWIRGDFYVHTNITATPVKILEITDDDYKILHQIDTGATYQLACPLARQTTPLTSLFTYIPSRVSSISDISVVLEFRVASISAANTAPVHIPPTCIGTLVI